MRGMSDSETLITPDKAAKIYHLLRSVEVLDRFRLNPESKDYGTGNDVLTEMATRLINQVAMDLGMSGRLSVGRQQ